MVTPEAAEVLDDPAVTRIVVEYRDRLAHFGAEHLEAALSLSGRSIVVLNPKGGARRSRVGHDRSADLDVRSPVWSPAGLSTR